MLCKVTKQNCGGVSSKEYHIQVWPSGSWEEDQNEMDGRRRLTDAKWREILAWYWQYHSVRSKKKFKITDQILDLIH